MIRTTLLITYMSTALICSSAFAGDRPALDTEAARQSYLLGYQAVKKYRESGAEPDLPALLRGMLDALSGNTPLLGVDEIEAAATAIPFDPAYKGVKPELSQIQQGRGFLTANSKKPGVITLPSGLQYRIIQPGTGRKPGSNDSVTVHYRGTLIDGSEFDSTYRKDKPVTYQISEVMPGWSEALQMMQEGAIWELVIPSRLGFGKRGPLENRNLVYRLELLSVTGSRTSLTEPTSGRQ